MPITSAPIGLRDRLYGAYWWLEKRIDPGVRSSQYEYADIVRNFVTPTCRWLDLGCGHSILPDWIPGQAELVRTPAFTAGLDYDQHSLLKHKQLKALVAGTLTALPFAPESFSLVTANMVVEHLAEPLTALTEVLRVLRPGGHIIFHTPNIRFYKTYIASITPQALKNKVVNFSEGRLDEDIFPAHYRINSWESIQHCAEQAGFELISLRALNSSAAGSIIMLGPFVVFDLLARRLSRRESLKTWRSNYIVVLRKP